MILRTFIVTIAMLLPLFSTTAGTKRKRQKDEDHRPPCTDARCRVASTYLKVHYCGESPFGEGPDDGCDLRVLGRKPSANVNALADYECNWNEKKEEYDCQQTGQPPANVRHILDRELQRLGLPHDSKGETIFRVWEATHSGLVLAEAYYHRIVGLNLELCEVIVTIDQDSHVLVLRKLPFQKTDADVPQTTEWSPVDLADVDGCGNSEIILEGDAYEDHWLEVISVRDGVAKTIFSGLGYYL